MPDGVGRALGGSGAWFALEPRGGWVMAVVAAATATTLIAKRLTARLLDALNGRAGRFISFASPKETNQRKSRATLRSAWRVAKRQAAKLWRSPASAPLRGTLAPDNRAAAAELARKRAQTVLAETPPACLPLGAAEGNPADHPLPRPLALKARGDVCECLRVKAAALTIRALAKLANLDFVFPIRLALNGLAPVTWRRGVEGDLRLPTDVGNPGGAQTRAAFSLVRFFWPRKRNEPACPAAKGVNRSRRKAPGVSGIGMEVGCNIAARPPPYSP